MVKLKEIRQPVVRAVAVDVRGGFAMGGWFGKLPDWQMAIAWLVTVAIGMLVYFNPISRLLDQLSE
jgi:hypothetical protein